MSEAVLRQVCERHGTNLERLRELVSIPSLSAPSANPAHLRDSANAVRDLLLEIGFEDVALLEIDGSHPFAELSAEAGRPTLLLYAHHDVQDVGNLDAWTSDPFVAVQRGGRLYGRGTADDKGGLVVHIAAIEAWLRTGSAIPVNVKVLIDGEEEIGSPHLPSLLKRERERLRSDAVVIPDSMNWQTGEPSLTCSLRGVLSVIIELRALVNALHSGIWGGVVPDPLMALSRVLSTLVEEDGSVRRTIVPDAVRRGGGSEPEPKAAFDGGEEFRVRVGLRPGVSFVGDPNISLPDRLWESPSLTIIGIDAPRVARASNTIQAVARARISMRLPPEEDPDAVRQRLTDHICQQVPWGLECVVLPFSAEAGWRAASRGPFLSAGLKALTKGYGHTPTLIGMGGSIPAVAMLGREFGQIEFLLTGIEDDRSLAHGIDESLELDDWRKACLAEALLFEEVQTAMALRYRPGNKT